MDVQGSTDAASAPSKIWIPIRGLTNKLKTKYPLAIPPHVEDVFVTGKEVHVIIFNSWSITLVQANDIKITRRLEVVARLIQKQVPETEGLKLVRVDRKKFTYQFSFVTETTEQEKSV